MSDKKEKRRSKKTREEPEEEVESVVPSENMISFNPATDVNVKLGQLVSIKNLLVQIIDTHPECKWNSDEILKLGMWMEELNKYVLNDNPKKLDKNKLNEVIKILKKENRKIVFTNGCFDIFHIGHLKYLKESKNFGDILMVAVNTDKSIKNNKGKNRPINTLKDLIA